jgi:hypothetical protein
LVDEYWDSCNKEKPEAPKAGEKQKLQRLADNLAEEEADAFSMVHMDAFNVDTALGFPEEVREMLEKMDD